MSPCLMRIKGAFFRLFYYQLLELLFRSNTSYTAHIVNWKPAANSAMIMIKYVDTSITILNIEVSIKRFQCSHRFLIVGMSLEK